MAYDLARLKAVKDAYVNKGQSIAAIARNTGLSEGTIRRWRKKDKGTLQDWDQKQGSISQGLPQTTIDEILATMISVQNTTLKDLEKTEKDPIEKARAITSLSDAFTKCMSIARKQEEKQLRLSAVGYVLEEFAAYLIQHHPDVAPTYLNILEPFGVAMSEKVERV
nr:DUF1804 family protein [uncultured Cohaesibacter sp.]